jgi:hypothetical protein
LKPFNRFILTTLIAAIGWAAGPAAAAARPPALREPAPRLAQDAPPETLRFAPESSDSLHSDLSIEAPMSEDRWLKPATGDHILTDADEWRYSDNDWTRTDLTVDYNRVDRLRLGLRTQFQWPEPMYPRIGARLEYAFDRQGALYGVQIEQPIVPPGRIALGVSMVRRTDNPDLQQVDNVENTLALLFARQDYRDYFEREGLGAYLSWRVPDFSTVSVHVRNDEYSSLPLHRGTRSFFYRDRPLRENPAIDEGDVHALTLRLERLAHTDEMTHAGVYHWIDLERAGHGLEGQFEYTRLLADLRSVIRLSPAQTLALRTVAGYTADGALPYQKLFVLGGPDGLRAHRIAEFRGDQAMLAQAEYTIGLWPVRSRFFEGGLHAIAFVDAGRAWSNPAHRWDVGKQRIETDGGVGLATSEDNLRIYFAKKLADPDSDFLVSLRLHRPF